MAHSLGVTWTSTQCVPRLRRGPSVIAGWPVVAAITELQVWKCDTGTPWSKFRSSLEVRSTFKLPAMSYVALRKYRTLLHRGNLYRARIVYPCFRSGCSGSNANAPPTAATLRCFLGSHDESSGGGSLQSAQSMATWTPARPWRGRGQAGRAKGGAGPAGAYGHNRLSPGHP